MNYTVGDIEDIHSKTLDDGTLYFYLDVYRHHIGIEPVSSGAGVFEFSMDNVSGVILSKKHLRDDRRPGQFAGGFPNHLLMLRPTVMQTSTHESIPRSVLRRERGFHYRTAARFVAVSLALFACHGCECDGFHKLLSKPEDGKPAGKGSVAAVQSSNTASFALWRAFAEQANFVVSPYSIRSALALVYFASLPGEGRSSLRTGLQYPERNDDLNIRVLDKAVMVTPVARFESANAVWITRKDTVSPTYLSAVSRTLPAEVHSIGFATDPERAQQMINAWASDRTRGKIPEIVQGGAITKKTRAVLVNAVYFFGKWLDPFEHELTVPKPFRTSRGATIKTEMMAGSRCSAVFNDDYRAAIADYKGTSLVFVVVVPKHWQRFTWDAAAFRRVWAALKDSREAELELPKFKLRSRKKLDEVLVKLGLRLDDPRLLQGLLVSKERTFIDLAVHEAFIQVDETSTEAAAATAISLTTVSAPEPPPVFRVDRPFYFLLVERRTGLVTFMGQVTDPTATGG